MKKSLLLLSFLLIFAALVMTGCTDDNQTKPCEHVFDGNWGSDGTSHWKNCSKCGAAAPEAEHVAHTWASEDYIAKEATCAEEGILANDCTVCDYKKIVPISKLKHTVGETFSANETKHWQTCTGCNTELNSADHAYNVPSYDKDNHWDACVCGTPGTKTAHTFAPLNNGVTGAEKCEGCDATRVNLPDAGHEHTYDNGVINTQPDGCTSVKVFTCTVSGCTASYTESMKSSHHFDGAWEYNDTHHWQNCPCGEKAPESERVSHNYVYDTATRTYKCECGKAQPQSGTGGGYVDPNGWT